MPSEQSGPTTVVTQPWPYLINTFLVDHFQLARYRFVCSQVGYSPDYPLLGVTIFSAVCVILNLVSDLIVADPRVRL